MKRGQRHLEAWLDVEWLPDPVAVGTLADDRGQIRFQYDGDWLRHPEAFALDPDLSLDKAPFFPDPERSNFGVLLDSSPDRWGQTLMRRREALEAKDEHRSARTLTAWDFLLGVQDETRQGALRFRYPGDTVFQAARGMAAPPVTTLRELEAIAYELSARKIDDLDKLRKWLAVLVAPGASLGGARPKANFTSDEQRLWIAKFPARDDDRDIGAWEGVLHKLARQAGITVPASGTARLGSPFHTFCAERFDRLAGRRRFYCSAMTLLRKADGASGSYLELAEFLRKQGARDHITEDLAQLFRRVVFNILVGHRDDHLRNHGFIMTPAGWRLAPAFDLNPIVDKAEHVLAIDDVDNRPDIETALSTSALYSIGLAEARRIVEDVRSAVKHWRREAAAVGIAKADIELTAVAFEALERRAAPRPV
ncbi:MAG TPA: type II toxin-antitoxin system HipA family toxin [Usitatibacter sp.]|nr:type II toxin-antitoxin system HipA family toxin [Usitatibacter sp.]